MQVNFTTEKLSDCYKRFANNTSYESWDIAAIIAGCLHNVFPTYFSAEIKDERFLEYYGDLEVLISEVIRTDAGSKASGCHNKLNQIIVIFSSFPIMAYQTEDQFYHALDVAFSGYFRFSRNEAGFALTKLW